MNPAPARRLLADRAYDALKGSLQSGKYPPGSFLSERRLARSLGMSKTPLKSALVRLEAEGFLRISPQQGIVVREPSVQEIVELFDLREAIETFVVQRIAGRLTPGQVEALRKNLKGQEEAVRKARVDEATRLDTEFHALICGFLGNREMMRSLGRMREKLHLHILGNLSRRPERMSDSLREHAAIAAALIGGRGVQAADLLRKHLEYGRRFVLGRSGE
ncbi:MAG: GntR family transcriptional regulator [Planctomycetes bacterium]|nr:GntR family transcriptional regulator [Planctomycetota bacterium]